MNVAEQLDRRAIARGVQLIRLEEGETQQVLRQLKELEAALIAALHAIDPAAPAREGDRSARLEKLLRETRAQIDRSYRVIAKGQLHDVEDLAQAESDHLAETVAAVVGVALLGSIAPELAARAAGKILFEGAAVEAWWGQQGGVFKWRYAGTLRQGLANREGLSQLVRRVRGTKEAGFRDGLMGLSRRDAESLVRTSVQAAANAGRLALYQKNEVVVRGVQARNPLDARTSAICRARAGSAWTLDGKPLPGTAESFPGPPPWHFRCRTILQAILRSWDELVRQGQIPPLMRRQLEALSREKRLALDGKPAQGLSYEGFLQELDTEGQQRILGPGRYELWKKGQIGMSDLISQTGRPLTLKQLKEQMAP